SPNSRNDLFIADSNFGMYPSDIDSCHSLKESREKYHWPEYINVATGKNSKERVIEAAELLDGALRLSGSVQSLDEKVLSNIKRKNISVDGLVELGLHSKRVGVNSYSEIILGLPGDSKQAHQDTIRKIIDAGFNIVLPWQLMLIHGSELATESNRKRYKMDVRARIFPRCYGSYRLFGKDINIAEVEEVCVANDTLPFEDYLECRRLNLFVAIFYNDTIFSGILKLLRSMDISIFDWILCLLEKSKGSKLEPLVDEFLNETNGELWSSKSDLKAFFSQKVNIKRYISGELGRNNLYFYRTLALTREIDTLRDLAREAALEVVNIAGHRDQALTQFISELVEYHSMRIRDIFTDYEDKIIGTFRYDFAAFEKTEAEFDELRATEPRQYEFFHNEEQRDLIKRSLHVHGSDSVGIARILSRVFVKKLYREVETKKALSA
ncbi:hypothetical protein N9E22_04780, partial [Burkholderiales bacterium]|nr:hypothetical protein [Burkholderiales bacterium]